MRVYFVRHGQSEANKAKIHSGWSQVSLSEEGIQQAKKVGEFLSDISFDKIYSSDLLRAMQTAEYALPGQKFQTDSLLREINVGIVAGKSKEQCTREYGELYTTHRALLDYRPFNGENDDLLHERAKKFIRKIETYNYENIAVFTHEGMLRNIIGAVLGIRVPVGRIILNNCTVVVCEYVDQVWKLSCLNPMFEKEGVSLSNSNF